MKRLNPIPRPLVKINATLKKMRIMPWLITAILFRFAPAMAQVDLHAHLYMKQGLGPLLRGNAKEEAKARLPSSHLDTKATEITLLSSGASRITVVSLYAHPWLSSPLDFHFRENVSRALDREYEELIEFVKAHADRVVFAKTPADARLAIQSGKQVLVLSIEGAYGALETEADLSKWVQDRGLSILGPFHLTEDYFGGVALLSPLLSLFTSPYSFLQSLMLSGGSCLNSVCTSPMGIKPAGRDLVSRLLEHRVWVDMAHANILEQRELLPEFKKRGIPLLVSHTPLQSHFSAERSLSSIEMEYLKTTGGIVGLIPSDDYLEGGQTGPCFSGLLEFKKQIQELEQRIGKYKVMIGSDFNSPLKGLSAACGAREGEILGVFESTGFFRQDQFKSLSDFVGSDPDWTRSTEEAFLSNWEKIRSH